MKLYQFSYRFYIYVAVLGIWIVLAAIFLPILSAYDVNVMYALLVLTIAAAFTRFHRYIGWAAVAVSMVIFVVFQLVSRAPEIFNFLATGGLGLFLAGIVLINMLIHNELTQKFQIVNDADKMIEQLSLFEPETRLVRWQYAQQMLKSEIDRSQRYHRDMCLILYRVPSMESQDTGNIDHQLSPRTLARIVSDAVRTVDIPFGGEYSGVILPETSTEGALIAAHRLSDQVSRKARLGIRIGVAYFPNDAVNLDNLVQAAETALNFAVESGQTIVFYAQIRNTSSGQQPRRPKQLAD